MTLKRQTLRELVEETEKRWGDTIEKEGSGLMFRVLTPMGRTKMRLVAAPLVDGQGWTWAEATLSLNSLGDEWEAA